MPQLIKVAQRETLSLPLDTRRGYAIRDSQKAWDRVKYFNKSLDLRGVEAENIYSSILDANLKYYGVGSL